MPQKSLLSQVLGLAAVFFHFMALEVNGQPRLWHVSDLTGNRKFSVMADTLIPLDSNVYTLRLKGESILIKDNPFSPIFRSGNMQFESADEHLIWQITPSARHLASAQTPLQIRFKNVSGFRKWKGKSLIRMEGKWIFRPGEPEELKADSFKTGRNRLFLFVERGIVEVDSLFTGRFFPLSGSQVVMNQEETYFLSDSIWYPFASGSVPVLHKPGFWWNDSLFAEYSAGGWYIRGSKGLRTEKLDTAFRISADFLFVKIKKQAFILSHKGIKIRTGPNPELKMVSDTLMAFGSAKNRAFTGPSGQKIRVNKTITEIGTEQAGLIIVKAGKRFGFADAAGFIRIACRYDSLLPFFNGRAAVKLGSLWGYLDKDEKLAIQPNFELAGNFISELAPVKKQGKWSLIGKNGQFVLPFEFDSIWHFVGNGFLLKKKGWVGMANEKGQMVLQNRFLSIIEASKNWLLTSREGKSGLYSIYGKSILELNFHRIEVYENKKRLIFY
jgi:hypothetical protein